MISLNFSDRMYITDYVGVYGHYRVLPVDAGYHQFDAVSPTGFVASVTFHPRSLVRIIVGSEQAYIIDVTGRTKTGVAMHIIDVLKEMETENE